MCPPNWFVRVGVICKLSGVALRNYSTVSKVSRFCRKIHSVLTNVSGPENYRAKLSSMRKGFQEDQITKNIVSVISLPEDFNLAMF